MKCNKKARRRYFNAPSAVEEYEWTNTWKTGNLISIEDNFILKLFYWNIFQLAMLARADIDFFKVQKILLFWVWYKIRWKCDQKRHLHFFAQDRKANLSFSNLIAINSINQNCQHDAALKIYAHPRVFLNIFLSEHCLNWWRK